jgi:hypothetical protein
VSQYSVKFHEDKRHAVYHRDGYKCAYCGKHDASSTGAGLSIDHIDSRASGGAAQNTKHSPGTNLLTACQACNFAKQDKTPKEWNAYIKARGLNVDWAKARQQAARKLDIKAGEEGAKRGRAARAERAAAKTGPGEHHDETGRFAPGAMAALAMSALARRLGSGGWIAAALHEGAAALHALVGTPAHAAVALAHVEVAAALRSAPLSPATSALRSALGNLDAATGNHDALYEREPDGGPDDAEGESDVAAALATIDARIAAARVALDWPLVMRLEQERDEHGRFKATGRSKAAGEARKKTKTAREASDAAKDAKGHAEAQKQHEAAAKQHDEAAARSRKPEHRASHERVAAEHRKVAAEHRKVAAEHDARFTKAEERRVLTEGVSSKDAHSEGMREETRALYEKRYADGKAAGKSPNEIAAQHPVRVDIYPDTGARITDGRHGLEAATKHGATRIPGVVTRYDNDGNEVSTKQAKLKIRENAGKNGDAKPRRRRGSGATKAA